MKAMMRYIIVTAFRRDDKAADVDEGVQADYGESQE